MTPELCSNTLYSNVNAENLSRVVKTTRYFKEQVLRKRSYLKAEWCEHIIKNPLKREHQEDGRVRFWGIVEEYDKTKAIRVITLEDGETIHNAFPDRNFPIAGKLEDEE